MDRDRVQYVVVNYKTTDLTLKCIASMEAVGISPANIIVVDNCSRDPSLGRIRDRFPSVTLVESGCNKGYGAAVNQGVARTVSEYVVIQNSDTVYIAGIEEHVTSLMRTDEKVAIIGLNLVNPDLTPQFSARRFYSLLDIVLRRTFAHRIWPATFLDDFHLMKVALRAGQVFDADWVMGTGFVVRRSAFEALHGMDEGYFLYMEDVDLCARAWQANHRVLCAPDAILIHDHQRASAQRLISPASRVHLNSLKRFASKFRIPLLFVRDRRQVLGDTR